MKNFELCNCLDNDGRICETREAEDAPSIEQKSFSLYSLAVPFLREERPKRTGNFKSITAILDNNILTLNKLQKMYHSTLGQ